jgi:hydrogenase expression/formation protein HypE
MGEPANFQWECPLPLRSHRHVVMGHGGGGKLSDDLIRHLFLPAMGGGNDAQTDAAELMIGDQRLAFTTDSFVVRPLVFPGGSIAELAVNGTVNDLAMMGAVPLALATGFILEEGLPLADLHEIARRLGVAAQAAGVVLATGDTKVVERGHGDQLFINTSGIGLIPAGRRLHPRLIEPGDQILVSGEIGLHGVAILSVREGLVFETVIASDCAPLHTLVAALLAAAPATRVLRDPTRGGVAASLNELAAAAGVGMIIDEGALPIPEGVAAACEMLGLDPLYVANEGKLVAIVAPAARDAALAALRSHPLGRHAACIGQVTAGPAGWVVGRTPIGGERIIDLPLGELLPRIC